MTYIAGVDIGNSTTEVCIGEVGGAQVHFLSSASCKTTGTKGTIANVHGIRAALKEAMGKIGMETEALSLIRLNEAAPVIGDTAMETLTETIITDSSMIGHNPSTPAGAGQAVGKTLDFERIREGVPGTPYIVFAKAAASYEEIAEVINRERKRLTITGVILQADEAVLVENRLEKKCRSLMRWREFKSFRMMFWQRSKWRFRDRQSVCFPTRTGLQRCSDWMQSRRG